MTIWADPPLAPKSDRDEVHSWLLDLEGPEPLGALWDSLDQGERERADRFRFQRDRDRFVRCRGALRAVLGRYLDLAADGIRFSIGPQGKPSLAHPNDGDLQFNLSHAERWALLAVTSGRPVGVDIERVDPVRVNDRIAERFFSPMEAAALRTVPAAVRDEAFFRCWTRKEAYVKARGEGLAISLERFSVSIDSRTPPRLLYAEQGDAEVARWELRDLPPPPGYAAALAVEGAGWTLRCWRCPPILLAVRGKRV
jgi:4'-phosphopantetheinyl transferase